MKGLLPTLDMESSIEMKATAQVTKEKIDFLKLLKFIYNYLISFLNYIVYVIEQLYNT